MSKAGPRHYVVEPAVEGEQGSCGDLPASLALSLAWPQETTPQVLGLPCSSRGDSGEGGSRGSSGFRVLKPGIADACWASSH